ncbi:AEC family transporter [Leptospira sp. 96542]|nr:AEC family transporter [Leptospira sp. 96542]
MENFFLLGVCFGMGLIFRRLPQFPENTPKVLNGFILYISLPSLVLYHIHELKFTNTALLPASMPWFLFLIATLFFLGLYKIEFLNFKTAVCLVLTAGLGNTSFVGFPILETYFGKESLGYGIIADQLGTFLALSFPGIILAATAESGNWNAKILFKRVIGFLPVYALVFALMFRGVAYPEFLKIVLIRLGDTLTPLALVSVGFMLDIRTIGNFKKHLFVGLVFKLIISPIIVYYTYISLKNDPLLFKTIVMESAMAPMVTSTIIAIEKNLNPHLASLMLGVGIPISFFSTAVVFFILEGR